MGEAQVKSRQSSGRNVVRYMLFPEILPRIQELGGSGFGYLAFLIASVYNAVRILPSSHPYTNPSNIGTFTIRQVIGAAAANVKLDRKHLDQVVIFFAILAGIVVLALQFILLVVAIFSGQAFAQETGAGAGFDGLFTTVNPTDDIAFMMLDHVFGIPEFFNSKVMADGQTPLHIALQALFRFYNMAILIVAVLIFLYFVLVVVTETAQTGTPFGQRFNSVYAPLRLVFAIGLLVPLNYGFNASQYITLMAAKMGSGLATNGWTIYNNTLKDAESNPLGVTNKQLIPDVVHPNIDNLAWFATVVHTCIAAYAETYDKDIRGYILSNGKAHQFTNSPGSLVGDFATGDGVDLNTARKLSKGGNIEVVFGELSEDETDVDPLCGRLTIFLSATNPEVFAGAVSSDPNAPAGTASAGPEAIQDAYYLITRMFFEGQNEGKLAMLLGERFASTYTVLRNGVGSAGSETKTCIHSGEFGDSDNCATTFRPPDTVKESIRTGMKPYLEGVVKTNIENSREVADFTITDDILKRGWGGAGMWYNRVADAGGAMVSAIKAFPTQKAYPEVMQKVRSARGQQSGQTDACDLYAVDQAAGEKINWQGKDMIIAQALAASYKYWCKDIDTEKGMTGNAIWDAMHIIFGTNGLFDLRTNSGNEVHPLAQMTAVGRSLVESSIKNVMGAVGFSVAGGVVGALGGAAGQFGAAMDAMSGFFVSIALIGLVAGFILFYILPFLPFIYFFFAVGKWVKTIFEAMVGAPLWALAHLRIDGDGFPGRSASNGYFLIFEIFIRPILAVFGLIGGLAIFTALALILNELFNIVVFNLTGADLIDPENSVGGTVSTGFEDFRRNIVDQFFFTIVYAVIMYMMAISSFKMIDLVPNNILRWIGAGVSSFSDQSQDATEGLVQYAAIGGYTLGGQLVGATQTAAKGVGQTLGAGVGLAASGGQQGGDRPQ